MVLTKEERYCKTCNRITKNKVFECALVKIFECLRCGQAN